MKFIFFVLEKINSYICKMKISFIKPKEINTVAKITIHKSGKMGFSRGASELLKLDVNKYAKFGFNEDKDFFIVITQESDDSTFSISKAGEYYYILAKSLLQEIGIDYTSKDTTIFDIKRTNEENIYKLNKRVIKKK